MKVYPITNKKISQLKEFESSLINLRSSIRSIKYEYKKNIKASDCPKFKQSYKEKLLKYTIKELSALIKSTELYH